MQQSAVSHDFCLVKKGEARAVDRGYRRLLVGCGWETPPNASRAFDLDVSCVLLNADGRMPTKAHFVYFGQLRFRGHVVVHTGDNLTGAGDGDDERLLIDLERMPSEVERIDIYYTIYEGRARQQTFGMLSECFIRIVDVTLERDLTVRGPLYNATSYGGAEFCRSEVNDADLHGTCMLFGSLVRDTHQGAWTFKSTQKEVFGGLDAVLSACSPEPQSLQQQLAVRWRDSAASGALQRVSQESLIQLCVDYRGVLIVVAMGAVLLSSIGVVPLTCLGLFAWLQSRASK